MDALQGAEGLVGAHVLPGDRVPEPVLPVLFNCHDVSGVALGNSLS